MNFNLTDKHIKIIRVTSQIAAVFTLIVAITILFSLVQLKVINPLDNPALLSVKEQYDRDPANAQNAEQVRAMDLMARKAYFSSRWQVESGSYLLLAGAVIFIICQQLLSGTEKIFPTFQEAKPDTRTTGTSGRRYLMYFASFVFVAAVGASFLLRAALPDPGGKVKKEKAKSLELHPCPLPILSIIHSSEVRMDSELPEVKNIRQSGTELKAKTFCGKLKYQKKDRILL